MIALAVYAAVVTVLLIIAACFLVVLVQEQKAIVRKAIAAQTETVARPFGVEELAELERLLEQHAKQRAKPAT